jgi:hypothetical protein
VGKKCLYVWVSFKINYAYKDYIDILHSFGASSFFVFYIFHSYTTRTNCSILKKNHLRMLFCVVHDKNGRVRVKHKLWRPVKSRSDIVGTFGLHSGAIELPMTDSVESMSEPFEHVRLVWPPSSSDIRRWWLMFGFLAWEVNSINTKVTRN